MRRFVTLLTISLAAACSPIIGSHGNLIDKEAFAQLQPGLQSKADVVTLLGEPSTISTFDPNIWFYIGQRTETIAFLRPEITDARVAAISFDGAGKIDAIALKGLQDQKDIDPISKSTPTAGKKLTFIEQLIGNVGRFNKGDAGGHSVGKTGAPTPY